MRALTSYISKFVLILVFVSGLSFSKAAGRPGGRLIVIRVANFGWNLVANLKIDGPNRCEHCPGSPLRSFHPAGRHILAVSAVPIIELRRAASITVNVRPGGTYIFTALWDSDRLSPADDVVSRGDGEIRPLKNAI